MKTIKTYIMLALAVAFVSCSSDEPQMIEGEQTRVEEVTPAGDECVAFELTDAESRAAEETATFDVAFFKAVCAAEADEAVVAVSPLSARILMAMVANAANDEAAAEIVEALGCTDLKALNTLSGKYLTTLGYLDPTATIQMANGVWYHEDYTLADAFKTAIEGDFGSETHSVDLYTGNTMNLINGWAAEKTNNKIPVILDMPIDQSIKAILANALYFSGQWSNPFDEKETIKDVFHGVNGDKVVDMMYMHDFQSIATTAMYTAVRLPLGMEGKLVATFVLPNAYTDVNDLIATMDFAELEQECFFPVLPTELYVPTFKVKPEKEYRLNAPLASLGITKINELLPSPMFSTEMPSKFDIIQKATIEVTEKGAEGAAITDCGWAAGYHDTPHIYEVKFDRPFLMYISHPETKAILLATRIGDIM
ncbi:MAG: hypothetical protein K2M55_04540 [Muribaculaceae bacterium]|nr:hypothetical protein [Muribaculaceae bacterium]